MSQAFTPIEIATIFEIWGIPKIGRGLASTSFTHIPPVLARTWESTFMVGSFAKFIEQLYISLDSQPPECIERARIYIARWDEIGGTSPLKIQSAPSGNAGVDEYIVDHPQERENIRQMLSNILGVVVPQGGYAQEMNRKLSYVNEYPNLGGDR